ncbi:MAG: glycosyltransferase family 1 protein [Anaerotruncus sp.]|nr:glycosyltransferase family 1 protein [Anaerotruncus sp.]
MNQFQRKIKICCFCESWESGGIESFLNNVLHQIDLDRLQVDIVVCCLKPSIFTEPLQEIGVRFFELSGNQKRLIQNHQAFLALIKKEQYDVVHLNVFQGLSLYYAKLAKQAGVSIRIVHSHNTDLRKSSTKLVKLLIHKVCRELYSKFATDFWACSKSAAEFLFSHKVLVKNGFHFIPNGIEIKRFKFNNDVRKIVRKELGIENKFVIGSIGRLCYQKNQEFILDVLSEIKKEGIESCVLFIGEGENLKMLQKKARNMGIEDSVIFYGTSQQVEELLWAMDLFVFPSRFEGFGIVVVEAQAAELSVLCSTNVPIEAIVTKHAIRLEISKGAGIWAKTILQLKETNWDLQADKIGIEKFDIQEVSKKIQREWVKHLCQAK